MTHDNESTASPPPAAGSFRYLSLRDGAAGHHPTLRGLESFNHSVLTSSGGSPRSWRALSSAHCRIVRPVASRVDTSMPNGDRENLVEDDRRW